MQWHLCHVRVQKESSGGLLCGTTWLPGSWQQSERDVCYQYFKALTDKLYTLYSTSNKNPLELRGCAQSLEVQLCSWILDTWWVASSFRTVEAVRKNSSRGSVLRWDHNAKYSGLAICISSLVFENNQHIMCDALQGLSELSLELQKGMVPSNSAHKAIFREIRVLEAMLKQPGHNTKFRTKEFRSTLEHHTEGGKPQITDL